MSLSSNARGIAPTTEVLIRAAGVGKRFARVHRRATSLKERLIRREQGLKEDFWALRDIDLVVRRGETVGLTAPMTPSPVTSAKKNRLLPSATPASAPLPSRPTMSVSMRPIDTCASCARMRGSASVTVRRTSSPSGDLGVRAASTVGDYNRRRSGFGRLRRQVGKGSSQNQLRIQV